MSLDPIRFRQLWPPDRHQQVEPILKAVKFVPADPTFPVAEGSRAVIGIGKALLGRQLWTCVGLGYQHILQEDREDFAFSLISTSLIASRPATFAKAPLPFIFRSYNDGLGEQTVEQKTVLWKRHEDKVHLIDAARKFFIGNPRTKAYRDVVAQLIDEMVSGSLQVKEDAGPGVENSLTLAYSADRLCIICSDKRDALPLKDIRKYFFTLSRGNGLPIGAEENIWNRLPVIVDLSTNFYFYSQAFSGSSMIALIDMRKGLRDLEQYPKNVHLFDVK